MDWARGWAKLRTCTPAAAEVLSARFFPRIFSFLFMRIAIYRRPPAHSITYSPCAPMIFHVTDSAGSVRFVVDIAICQVQLRMVLHSARCCL